MTQANESPEKPGRFSIALREALVAGMGIALIPTFLVGPLIGEGALVSLLDGHPTAESHILYAVYPQNRYLSPKVQAFVGFLSNRFGDVPPLGGSRSRERGVSILLKTREIRRPP